jgi:pullulanase/glycogen debranching enzyme
MNYLSKPYPLGSTWDGEGVNLALFSEHAEQVELCADTASLLPMVEEVGGAVGNGRSRHWRTADFTAARIWMD